MRRVTAPLFALVVVSVLLFAVTLVHAEDLTDGGKAGLFLVNKEGALAKAGVTFEANQSGSSTLSVPGRNLDILCRAGEIKGEFKSDTEALAAITFQLCSAWQHVIAGEHSVKLPCSVLEPVRIFKSRILPKKHEGVSLPSKPYISIEEDGEILTSIKLEGAECTLPKNNEVKGSISAAVDFDNTTLPNLLFNEAIQKLMGNKLLFGTFAAYLNGESLFKLTDAAHIGLTFGVA